MNYQQSGIISLDVVNLQGKKRVTPKQKLLRKKRKKRKKLDKRLPRTRRIKRMRMRPRRKRLILLNISRRSKKTTFRHPWVRS